jgi:hypothetical protein
MQSKQVKMKTKMARKSTDEIRTLLSNSKLDFDFVQNDALNYYLPRILQSCPFTEDICTEKKCLECTVYSELSK